MSASAALPQEYLCRRCGATYTSLDAVRLLDLTSGAFRCEECAAELDSNIDAAGLGSAGGAASRQQLQVGGLGGSALADSLA
jgi:DNA-directed RNA polymerase subunit RPC12/RpoP